MRGAVTRFEERATRVGKGRASALLKDTT
jgi:hypothetical protein